MKIGICTDIKNLKKAQELGYDYIEGKLNSVAALSDEDFEAILKDNEGASISVERMCLLLPKTLKVVGDEYDEKALDEYLKVAFSRMNRLGASLVVFGSGKSRNVPEGMDKEEGFEKLACVTRHIAEVAEKYGIVVAIEPLNRGESNIINSVSEGDELVKRVAHPSVQLLADAYHMRMEDEDMSVIGKVSPLAHAHIAAKEGRAFPRRGKETEEFMEALKATGYSGYLSIEASGNWDWIGCSPEALEALRSYIGG